jgi:16S rRNA (cytosine1402-N4)-methyltransferase
LSPSVTTLATSQSAFHAPVLVHEVVELLRHAEHVLDCTLGGGGHALALLERGALVTGVDRDPESIAEATERLAAFSAQGRFRALNANFADVDDLPEIRDEHFDGILMDLGVSGHQLDVAGRGFTFRPGAPLDMRMSDAIAADAARVLNEWDARDLERVFREYGDAGGRARRLAQEVVRRRQRRAFRTSDDLVNAIRAVFGPRSGPAEFAPVFQAVRIAVNDELTALARALPALRDRLTPGGTLAVIAYHSGEDRLVKQAFRAWSASCICPPRQPVCTCRGRPLGETLTRRAVVASPLETANNPRARSAHLRAWRSAR